MHQENLKSRKADVLTVVGLGQVGELLLKTFTGVDGVHVNGVGRDYQLSVLGKRYPDVQLSSAVDRAVIIKSDVIVVAVDRRGLVGVLDEIGAILSGRALQPVIVLCQNGVLAPSCDLLQSKWERADWVRVSLFTAVSRDAEGEVVYHLGKLKVAVAQMQGVGSKKVTELFDRAGYKTEVCTRYEVMEVSKLLLNTIGTTGVVTGLNMEETFADPRLFALEVQGIRERMGLIKAMDLEVYNFWKLSIPAKLLGRIFQYTPLPILTLMRGLLARVISGERGKSLSSAATQVNAGKKPKEFGDYHQPFVEIGQRLARSIVVDRVLLSLTQDHYQELGKMNIDERVTLLLDFVK